jgi:TatD DNase family protein
MALNWFDSHCHLHLCEEGSPAGEIVDRARAAGVSGMVCVGIDVESSERSLQLASDHSLYASAGVHPNSANSFDDAAAARIEELLAADRAVAVGETGLDFYRDLCPHDVQRRAFFAHIDLAKRHDKALVIHTRDSIDAALDVLESQGPPERFVFHCWSGGVDQLVRALDLGAFISFAGNVTFKNGQTLRTAARGVPLDRLLIETDSPFLAPAPHRGTSNEPSRLVDVGRAVAAAVEIRESALASSSTANAGRLFAVSE